MTPDTTLTQPLNSSSQPTTAAPVLDSRPACRLGGLIVGDSVVKNALSVSIVEGSLCTVMIALTETFAVAAAITLKAPPMAIGLLGSLPLFLASLIQLLLPSLLSPARGRKFYVARGAFLQALFLIACALTGLMKPTVAPYLFIAFFILSGISGSTIGFLWQSWIKDLTPEPIRGRHFAWRNRIFAAIQLCCTLGVGFLARRYTVHTTPWQFYLLIFLVAASFRLSSSVLLHCQFEPRTILKKMPLRLRSLPRPFLVYAALAALLQGATAFSGPFFSVWFLRDLQLDYLSFTIASAATLSGSLVFLPLWGRWADKFGNFALFRLTALLIAIVPFPYLFWDSREAVWLFNCYSGIVWSGFNLSNFNYLLQASGDEAPERNLAVAAAFSGIAVFCGGALGGIAATRVPELFGWQLRSLFFISGSARVVIALILITVLRPVSGCGAQSAVRLFESLPGYRSGMGLYRTFFRAFRKQ